MESLPKTLPTFQIGDRVGVHYWPQWRGRIVELRGPLAPGGVHVYRIRLTNFHKPRYNELREDQIYLLPDEEKASK